MNKFYSLIAALTSLFFIQIQSFAQFSLPGELDTTFNFGRPLSFFIDPNNPQPGEGANNILRVTVLQPDGKVLIGGNFTTYNGLARNRIARINADGSPDSTFNPIGGANGEVLSIVLQPDGKVLIGGVFTIINGVGRNFIARLNSNGSLDLSFNPSGGANNLIWSTALQPDGKILIGGAFTSYNGTLCNRIARLNTDGSLDATFSTGTGANSFVTSIALQLDGKVLIGGGFDSYNGTNRDNIARLNSNGSLDATFNPGTGANSTVWSVALQPDGKVLIGGQFTSYNSTARNFIARVNTSGSLDATFSPSIGANSVVWSIAVQPDGKVLIGGSFTSYDGIARNCIARLNADASLDTTLNPVTGAGGVSNPDIHSISLQPDGKVLIGGDFLSYNSTARNFVARINVDGSTDVSFESGPGTGANRQIRSLALQPNGNVLIGGDFNFYNGKACNFICRLNSNGNLDTTFNTGTGANNTIRSIVLQPDGKVLIAGNFTFYNGTARNRVARLNADGSLDATFNPGTGANLRVVSMFLQPDGKVLIGGDFTNYNGATRNRTARLNADGSLDFTFDPGSGASSTVESMVLQPDGKVLISGWFTSYNGTTRNRVARANANGTLDATFNPGSGAGGPVFSLAYQPDGKVLIGGFFTTYNGISRNRIARLNADGSLDATFNPGTGANSEVYSIALQTDGKVLIGGIFTSFNGSTRNKIARLNSNGSLDAAFDPDTGINGIVYSFSLQPDSKALVGGFFTTYNGIYRPHIARIFSPSCITLPSAPTVQAPNAICAGTTATIIPTAGGVNYRFYADSLGGIPLVGGNGVSSYTTTFLSNTTTYHVSSISSAGCESNTRTPVTVTVITLPSLPTASNISICGPGTVTISPSAGGVSYRFYASATGGSPLAGGNGVGSFTTPTLTSTTTYHVSSLSAVGCESSTRRAVTVTVNTIPSVPTVPTPAPICSGTSASIIPTAGGANYRFYLDSISSTPLAGGNGVSSFLTSVLNTATTFFVASVSSEGCESNTRAAVTVTVNPLPSAPTAPAPSAICLGTNTTITPTAGGVNYRFFANSTGGSPLAGGNGVASYTTPNLSNTTTYHVASVSSQGCESNTRTAVTVTVNPLPPAPTVPAPAGICAGTSSSIVPTAGGSTYRFYSAATGGSPLAGGNGVLNYVTPILSSNTTYFVSSLSAQGCESSTRTPVTVLVNLLPNVVVTIVNDTLRASIIIGAYQWLLDGVIIPGANSSLFVPTQSGNYSAQVTSPQGCVGVSAPVVFIVSGSETDLQNPSTVDVFPNPIEEELHIKSELHFDFAVTDILGNVLLKGQKLAGDQIISTERLASGSYFLQVISERGILNKKLIKQ